MLSDGRCLGESPSCDISSDTFYCPLFAVAKPGAGLTLGRGREGGREGVREKRGGGSEGGGRGEGVREGEGGRREEEEEEEGGGGRGRERGGRE